MKAILLVLRGLHLGYIGCYGNDWIATPNLDRLAAEGIVFDQHFSDCPDAEAARRAWRTGISGLPPARPRIGVPDLLALLHARGVATRLIVEDSLLSELMEGWSAIRRVPCETNAERPLDAIMEFVADSLDDLAADKQGLLWVEVGALLPPWTIPAEQLDLYFHPREHEEEEENDDAPDVPLEPSLAPAIGPLPAPADESFLRLQSTYAGAVSLVDGAVGCFHQELRDHRLAEETLLIVTTDHGQALGEHGIVGPYRPWLHDELIHLPLLMRLPGAAEAGRRVAALTQPVDLFATLLAASGIDPPSSHGYSLLPLARGEVELVRSHACCGLRLGEREEWALRTPEWSFLLPIAAPAEDPPRFSQLYVKPDDRWEVNNVLQHHLELAERLEQALRTGMAAPGRIAVANQPL
jgi:arylsulfatase A-like enzyme